MNLSVPTPTAPLPSWLLKTVCFVSTRPDVPIYPDPRGIAMPHRAKQLSIQTQEDSRGWPGLLLLSPEPQEGMACG